MPQDVTRKLGPSKSQSVSWEAVGNAEDFSDILVNIEPTSTPILSRLATGDPLTGTDTTWLTKKLNPPSENAHLEMEDYVYEKVGQVEGLKNYVQLFQNTGKVSDVQNKIKKMYNIPGGNSLAEATADAITKQAIDIEYRLISGDTANQQTDDSTPAHMGGIPYFMNLDTQDVTVSNTDGKVTASKPHNLKTGDFVYFIAKTMPTNVKAGAVYYVNVESTTVFTIYDNLKDAVNKNTSAKVTPGSAGAEVKLVKANVKSLGKANDYELADIDDVMAMAANRGGKPTDAYMAMEKKRRFSQLVSNLATTSRKPKDRYGSVVADTYETDGGVITAHSHRMYSPNRIDILDFGYWELRWLEKTHEVKGLAKKGSYSQFVVESKLTLQASQPKSSAAVIDIKR